ncbi:MAG: hypothetical protein Q4Q03_00505 [Bowdeniella nasicola]|nr:hypothetical protein [Bowdeniella nasicola]
MSSRSTLVAAITLGAVAMLSLSAIASAVDLDAARRPSDLPALPAQGEGRLTWPPAATAGTPPQPRRVPGTASVDCYQWPDGTWTQTGQRTSPACQATWDFAAGNGGATSTGVDGGTIKIGVAKIDPVAQALTDAVNQHYQLYGRALQLVELGPANTPVAQAAFVANARAQGVFAATPTAVGYPTPVANPDALVSQLATAEIIGVLTEPVHRADTLTSLGPYPWSTREPLDRSQRWMGELVCEMLAHHPAEFSTQTEDQPRKFGILAPSATALAGVEYSTDTLSTYLDGCGIAAKRYEFTTLAASPQADPRDEATYAQMRADGITTVLYFTVAPSTLSRAQAQFGSYRPEIITAGTRPAGSWLLPPPKGTRQGIISITDQSPAKLPELTWGAQVVRDRDLDDQDRYNALNYADEFADAIGLIAAGIQGAGPDLTPESFRAGLETSYFPNPGAGQRPDFQAHVGLQVGDHVAVRDVAVGIWNYDTRDPVRAAQGSELPGHLCLVGGGTRFDADTPLPRQSAVLRELQTGQCPGTAVPSANNDQGEG